ncbi:MAG: extracellular solute-binding protein [Lachnospiraceae bacterium]|nr:extracellular solute-binding protein [Lachnospiraceae bacterium]
MRKREKMISLLLACTMPASMFLTGCGQSENTDGKTVIELVQYKQEAVDVFRQLEEEFNRTHDDILLKIDSPNDATTIMKTRFIREDYPDILGIGGDINYSYFIDAGILADVSDYPGLADINQGYRDILEGLEFVPTEGTYGVPYVANAAGILYNREMFKEHGWEIPETWEELITLCETIQSEGILPFYFGFKDTWTCLAPWNSLAVDLAPADVCQQVNGGKTVFADEYREVAEKIQTLVTYGEDGPFAYGYNDACTAFANGESAMFAIGSYAVPQIKSVNPDMDIDSFVTPGSSDPDGQILNSGVDLQFCVTSACMDEGKKEAAYEVLNFLLADENVQMYLDDQSAVPCKTGDFTLAPNLDGMTQYITEGKIADYQDHYYPSEMAVDAQIQTFLIEQDIDAFLAKFDTDWVRYNRDIIQMVADYNKENGIQ